MLRAFACITFAAVSASVLFGQSNDTKPTFDLADVHSSPHTTNANPFVTGGVLRLGRYDLRKATMLDLITMAYGMDPQMVLGGPNWLETDRFDIVAQAPQGTPPETVKLMVQNLLAERFKLELHKDNKPVPAYALTVAKGKHKLKEADGKGVPGCQGVPQKPEPGTVPLNVVSCHAMSTEALAQTLRGMGGDYVTSPVIDMTGLKGNWDFELKWTGRAQLPRAGSDGISFFDAVEKQLGLKLELQKAPAPVLVVDRVNQKPTENSPEVAKALPPPPLAEFEVADVKLSEPDTQPNGRIQPGGRLDLQGLTLKMLLNIAWNINDDELLAGAPKWADSTRYTILAKTSTATSGTANAQQIDIDDLRLMLRALLADRLKLATHYEDRPVTAYTMMAAKPKLTKADPANRTGCKEANALAKDPRNSNPGLSRLVTCLNISMPQFAEELQRVAPGYIHTPVLDATSIQGNFDITLSFSTAGFIQQGAGGGGRGGAGAGDGGQASGAGVGPASASDPSGGLSLFDAMNKQLGLNLEKQKRPMPVLVIDHVEEKPTDN
jgi:uncharacterized protein (TIGR03435 family)